MTQSVHELELLANDMRHNIVHMIEKGKSGHPGGSLSVIDILTTLFFSGVMKYNQQDPTDKSQDRFILSKGHAAPALYAVFHKLGWLEDQDLETLRQLNSKLQGHPDAHACPGVEVCAGSLGQGLSVASGLAQGLLWDAAAAGEEPHHVFCVCGDGEMQEGSNWEALMYAAHAELSNLIMILDLNGLQIDGFVDDVNSLGDVPAKLTAFGWHVLEVDGHNIEALIETVQQARAAQDKPVAIVAHTVKGKGVDFMENQASWHGSAPNAEQAREALSQLDALRAHIEEA